MAHTIDETRLLFLDSFIFDDQIGCGQKRKTRVTNRRVQLENDEGLRNNLSEVNIRVPLMSIEFRIRAEIEGGSITRSL